MVAIQIESKRESVMYAIALGCVFLFIIGLTWFYWNSQTAQYGSMDPYMLAVSVESAQSSGLRAGHENPVERNTSIWFYGALIVSLLLLFGVTFRYYSHREMKKTEKKWNRTCQTFLTRMEVERANYEDRLNRDDTVWTRILKGDSIDEREIMRMARGRKISRDRRS